MLVFSRSCGYSSRYDSLALAVEASKTSADKIILCGVHFMAETAKLMSPEKKVYLPDMEAGSSVL